jgi:hypothetical protein
MRATEIIRNILDIIDGIDAVSKPIEASVEIQGNADEIRRFKHIVDLTQNDTDGWTNSPNEKITDVDAVTVDAGGGVNGPKHPADLRVKDPSMYPNQQEF